MSKKYQDTASIFLEEKYCWTWNEHWNDVRNRKKCTL